MTKHCLVDLNNTVGKLLIVLQQAINEDAKVPVVISRITSSMQSDISFPHRKGDFAVGRGQTTEESSTASWGCLILSALGGIFPMNSVAGNDEQRWNSINIPTADALR